MIKNYTILILSILSMGSIIVIDEANRAKFWTDEYTYAEMESAYVEGCAQNSEESMSTCFAKAHFYVEEQKNNEN
jgi:hypothetical protein